MTSVNKTQTSGRKSDCFITSFLSKNFKPVEFTVRFKFIDEWNCELKKEE